MPMDWGLARDYAARDVYAEDVALTEAEWLAATDPGSMLNFLARGSQRSLPRWYYRFARRPPPPDDRPRASTRKLRLFARACCRRVWDRIFDPVAQSAVELAERFVEGEVAAEELLAAARAAARSPRSPADGVQAAVATALAPEWNPTKWPCAESVTMFAVLAAGGRRRDTARGVEARNRSQDLGRAEESAAHCALVRELFGDFFRPAPAVDPAWLAWRGGTVAQLAQAAYEERHLPEGTLDLAHLAALADALEEAGCIDAQLLGHLRGPGQHVRGCWAVDLVLGKS
jgi:hypothetical protein